MRWETAEMGFWPPPLRFVSRNKSSVAASTADSSVSIRLVSVLRPPSPSRLLSNPGSCSLSGGHCSRVSRFTGSLSQHSL